MAGRLFDHLESNVAGKSTKRKLTLPVSIALHVAVLFAVIVVPLLTWTDLPEPAEGAVRAFFVEPAAPPPPPPPPPPPAAPKPAMPNPRIEPAKVTPVETPKFVAPVEVPKEITADPTVGSEGVGLDTSSDAGVPGGVAGGVAGGVEGGVVGGVVGGVLGGVPEPAATPAPAPAPTPEPEVPKAPVRVGGKISEPRKVKNVPPAYPDVARQARVSGVVVLECTISPEGRVTGVRVLRGIPLLNDAAVSAVRQWAYTPTLLNGEPVPVIMTVTVNFKLD